MYKIDYKPFLNYYIENEENFIKDENDVYKLNS
jgi:hypothetical protein